MLVLFYPWTDNLGDPWAWMPSPFAPAWPLVVWTDRETPNPLTPSPAPFPTPLPCLTQLCAQAWLVWVGHVPACWDPLHPCCSGGADPSHHSLGHAPCRGMEGGRTCHTPQHLVGCPDLETKVAGGCPACPTPTLPTAFPTRFCPHPAFLPIGIWCPRC